MPGPREMPTRSRCECDRTWHACARSTDLVGTSLVNSRSLAQLLPKHGRIRAK